MNRSQLASLTLSASALVWLAMSEGFTDRAIQPLPGDKWTYGFGTTDGVKPGDTISPPKALERKLRDVQAFEGALKQCVTVPLAQGEYDAYVSLAYNIGGTAFCSSTLVPPLIHISEPTRLGMISYAVFCWKKKKGLQSTAER